MQYLIGRKRQIILSLGIFFFNYFFDRFTKYIAIVNLKGKESKEFFNNIIVLVYTENTGAFLSLGKNWNIYVKYVVLLIIPIIICLVALLYLMIKEIKNYRIITCSCIIGGGIGNLFDRLFNEFTVTDFLNFGIGSIRTGILNMADISVTFGIIALIIFDMKNRSPANTHNEEFRV
jgi:signal peptidase II